MCCIIPKKPYMSQIKINMIALKCYWGEGSDCGAHQKRKQKLLECFAMELAQTCWLGQAAPAADQ